MVISQLKLNHEAGTYLQSLLIEVFPCHQICINDPIYYIKVKYQPQGTTKISKLVLFA